ncbi:hypothetical protein ES703_24201 [subsurface metagenome]
MLKKAIGFELTDLLAIVVILGIIAALIAPIVVTSIQKSNQKNIMKDSTHIDIIEKIKASKKTFNIYIQGIMGVNRAEKELAKATEIYKKRHPEYLGRTKPWERNDSNLNNSGLREKKAGIQEVSNVKKN